MNINKIFSQLNCFKNIRIDMILFEANYPILFTCLDDNKIYLIICCLVSGDKIEWIATETDIDILIKLLNDKITIRDAFLAKTDEKLVITYYGPEHGIKYTKVKSHQIEQSLLPKGGEFMDVEEGEFDEEILELKQRKSNHYYTFAFEQYIVPIKYIQKKIKYGQKIIPDTIDDSLYTSTTHILSYKKDINIHKEHSAYGI